MVRLREGRVGCCAVSREGKVWLSSCVVSPPGQNVARAERSGMLAVSNRQEDAKGRRVECWGWGGVGVGGLRCDVGQS